MPKRPGIGARGGRFRRLTIPKVVLSTMQSLEREIDEVKNTRDVLIYELRHQRVVPEPELAVFAARTERELQRMEKDLWRFINETDEAKYVRD